VAEEAEGGGLRRGVGGREGRSRRGGRRGGSGLWVSLACLPATCMSFGDLNGEPCSCHDLAIFPAKFQA
jgi:hypothetical protein